MEKEEIASVKEDLLKKADVSKSMFGSSPEELSLIHILGIFLLYIC